MWAFRPFFDPKIHGNFVNFPTYGITSNATNKYCCLVETIITKCLKHFIKVIHEIFE
jgi:hypothetical protein